MSTKKLMVCLVSIIIAGCGIKGPPLPPLREETVQKQKTSETISADETNAQTQEKK